MKDPKEVEKQIEALNELINSPSRWSAKVKTKLEEAREKLENQLKSIAQG